MIAHRCCISKGKGSSKNGLPSFDRALLEAGVGNYNLQRLSSILPAHCQWVDASMLPTMLKEGSLLPVAYSTISSDKKGDELVSSIGVGFPKDKNKVGVIMEYSVIGVPESEAVETLKDMIREAFEVRGWELEDMKTTSITDKVEEDGVKHTTFACIAEWC